jgi:hypothetical protein
MLSTGGQMIETKKQSLIDWQVIVDGMPMGWIEKKGPSCYTLSIRQFSIHSSFADAKKAAERFAKGGHA